MSRSAVRLEQAASLIAAGNPTAAVGLLRKSLNSRNPFTSPVNDGTRDIAETYVRLTIDDPADTATIGWTAYLRRATLSQYGETDVRTHDAGRLVVELTQRRGAPTSTADLLTVSPAGRSCRAGKAVADRFAVVALLHECGLCEPAEREAIAALCQWAPHHDDAPDVTYTYLVETLVILEHCGRIRQAESVLHAYAAMLPEPGTEGDTFLRAHVRLRLGNQREIQCHEKVCRICPQYPRPCYEDLRSTILHLLAHGERPSPPSAARESTAPSSMFSNSSTSTAPPSPRPHHQPPRQPSSRKPQSI